MDVFQYNQIAQQQELENYKKTEDFLLRIKPFEKIFSLSDAQSTAEKILPTKQEYTSFYVGNAKCSVVNKKDIFRLCVETPDNFVCYDFS